MPWSHEHPVEHCQPDPGTSKPQDSDSGRQPHPHTTPDWPGAPQCGFQWSAVEMHMLKNLKRLACHPPDKRLHIVHNPHLKPLQEMLQGALYSYLKPARELMTLTAKTFTLKYRLPTLVLEYPLSKTFNFSPCSNTPISVVEEWLIIYLKQVFSELRKH